MNEIMTTVFGLAGGLAMFLFGMNSMSDALQKAAGERMKQILSFLTKNPIMGALAGALVTAVLQSSSATTVMVIGFVSAGLMTLPQGISVIFGANIGTTMTAQLMAFKISDYIYPIIFIGFLVYFIAKSEKAKNIGMVIFSFGLLFEGIEIMGSVMKPLAGSAVFTDLMGRVSEIPALGVLLGAAMTLVVQSSSATIAVLQNFASQPAADGVTSVIGLAGAIPILLGDNIGTTITALLASIGQSKAAKRTAISHSIFNITGSIVFACLIRPFAAFITYISPSGNEVDVIARQIANAHTCFNIVCGCRCCRSWSSWSRRLFRARTSCRRPTASRSFWMKSCWSSRLQRCTCCRRKSAAVRIWHPICSTPQRLPCAARQRIFITMKWNPIKCAI